MKKFPTGIDGFNILIIYRKNTTIVTNKIKIKIVYAIVTSFLLSFLMIRRMNQIVHTKKVIVNKTISPCAVVCA